MRITEHGKENEVRPQRENRREKTTVANTAESKTMRHRRRMSEAKAVRIVRKTIAARNAEYRDRSNYRGRKREYRDRNDNGEKREYRERTNYRGRNYNRDRGENADRENSGGGGENANTAESGISGAIETTTERIIRVETTNVENKNRGDNPQS